MNPCYSCVWGQDSTNIPSPRSDGEWCWVQSSLPASCIIPALLDVGFIWELITLWQATISMEGHKVCWFWWPAKAFVYRHGGSFFRAWLRAPMCGKRKHFGDVSSSGGMNQYPFCCAKRFHVTQAGLSRHICKQRVSCICHLWSSALPLKRIPGSDSHTLTDKQPHRHSQTVLQLTCVNKAFPLEGQFVWFLLLFHCVRIDILHSHCKHALCNQ